MFANGVWHDDQKLWEAAAFIKRMNILPAAVKQTLEQKPNSPQN